MILIIDEEVSQECTLGFDVVVVVKYVDNVVAICTYTCVKLEFIPVEHTYI